MARKTPGTGKGKQSSPSDDSIADMIDARDAEGLAAALDAGLDPAWTDAAGRSLAHFAALWGDPAALDAFIARGVSALSRDSDNRTPADAARAFGHDALAHRLAARSAETPAADEKGLDGFASLADLRRATVERLSDQFNHVAGQGALPKLLALARAAAGTPEGLTAADLLGRGPDGDTTILKICQQGQLGLLLDAGLWKGKAEEFRKLWDAVPRDYAAGHDAAAVLSAIEHTQLQSLDTPGFRLGRRPPKP